jgi:hypothetical protein
MKRKWRKEGKGRRKGINKVVNMRRKWEQWEGEQEEREEEGE